MRFPSLSRRLGYCLAVLACAASSGVLSAAEDVAPSPSETAASSHVVIVISETVAVTDTSVVDAPPTVLIVIAEQVGVSDGSEVRPPVVIAIAEAVGVSDGSLIDAPPTILIAIGEAVGVSDGSDVLPPVVIAIAEAVGVSDGSLIDAPPTVLIVIAEQVGVSDGSEVRPPVVIEIAEAVGVSDGSLIDAPPTVLIVIAEQVGVSDGSEVRPPVVITIAEAVGVSDGSLVDAPPTVLIAIVETVGVSDGSEVLPPVVIAITEAVGVSDGSLIDAPPTVLIVIAEQVGVSDGSEVRPPVVIEIAEAVGISDGSLIDAPPTVLIAIVETVGVSDGADLGDGDQDGIFAPIDGQIVAGQFEEDTDPSEFFTDQHTDGGTGTTFGFVDDVPGGLLLTVADVAAPTGVVVAALGDSELPASLTLCGDPAFTVEVRSGDVALLTCGSLTISSISGAIQVELDDTTTLTVPADVTVIVSETPEGAISILSPDAEATVQINGVDIVITSGAPVALRANHVDLHIVNQTKDPKFCDGSGSCKLPLPGAEIRVFDRNDPDFVDVYGKTPAKSDYATVFDGEGPGPPVGLIGSCTTDASGTCTAPETVGGSALVIVHYVDEGHDVFTGKPVGLDADQASDPPPNEFQILQVRRRGGNIQYSGGSKVRLNGSYLEIIYPDFAVWEDVAAGYIYPFIFISDSSWTADVCARVPVGYEITGYFDEDGDFVSDLSCSQTFIEEGSRVIAFEVVDHESPEPQLRARLRVRNPHGVVTVLNLDVPGLRIAAERARGGPFATLALVPSQSLPWALMFDPMRQ